MSAPFLHLPFFAELERATAVLMVGDRVFLGGNAVTVVRGELLVG